MNFAAKACLIAAVMAGAPAVAHAQPAGNVVDKSGKFVGVFSGGQAMTALREIQGTWVALPVNTAGFASGGQLYFASEDCSGQAFFPAASSAMQDELAAGFNQDAVIGADLTLYYLAKSDSSAEPETENLCSVLDVAADQCSSVGCQGGTAYPVTTFDLSSLKLKAPFSIK